MVGKLGFQEERDPELVCMEIAPPAAPEGKPPARAARPGLYLRVPSQASPQYKKAMQYIAVFDEGLSDIYLRFADTGKLVKAPAKYRAAVNRPLLHALEKLLGEGNVSYTPPG